MRNIKVNPLFAIILILSPFIVYRLSLLLPTFDDWDYFTTPDYDYGENFLDRLIPRYTYWRPWDGIIGYILSLKPAWFPALNHIIVYLAHLGGTITIYLIAKELKFKSFACNMTALYFFISPAMLGTVLGIDSPNQAYSSFWGLLSVLLYIRLSKPYNIILWLTCALIGTFAKENAIAYFVVPQIIAFGFKRITLSQALKDTIWAVLIVIIYFSARYLLTSDVVYINEEYFENTFSRKFKNICVFLGMTWLPLDFVSLVHPPCRNIPITIATMLLSFPFMIVLFANKRKYWINLQFSALVLSLLAAASPHLTTLFTAMHPYAGLGMAALIVGYMADKSERISLLKKLLPLFIISCIFIDWHHWQKSYESGLIGKRMAQDILNSTKKPVNRVYLIIVNDDAPKYSSFCVIPRDAFGRGKSVCSLNGYVWPKDIEIADIEEDEAYKIDSIADKAITEHYEAVWLVQKDSAKVIR